MTPYYLNIAICALTLFNLVLLAYFMKLQHLRNSHALMLSLKTLKHMEKFLEEVNIEYEKKRKQDEN